jgi:hypothetical protein
VRNDGEEPLRVVWQLPGGREQPVEPIPAAQAGQAPSLAPGSIAEAGFISGPPDPQRDIIVKAFNPGGTLVYCRRVTPSEYRTMTSDHPLNLKPGQIGCA